MTSFLPMAAMAAAVLAAGAAVAQPAASLEVRFCPGAAARTYPLQDSARIQGLVVHNVSVVNTGTRDVPVRAIELQLLDKGKAIDVRRFEGPSLEAAAKGGARTKASGQMEMIPFQYCGGKLLGTAGTVSDDAVLQPGEALLVMRQMFAWRGPRDQLRVNVSAEGGGAEASLPIVTSGSKTVMRFPLDGRWFVAVGATPHGGHRWLQGEEFALDIARLGADMRTFRTNGVRFSDYYAYGAPVLAAADGTVVVAVDGQAEDPEALRKPGESLEAYGERVGQVQAALLAKGLDFIAGDHVIVDHGNGEYSLYAHLKPGSVLVKAGQAVKAGQPLARLGSSGNSTEPHLHFQVCDAPSPLACAGVAPTFEGVELPFADGPRAIQAGDIVIAGPIPAAKR